MGVHKGGGGLLNLCGQQSAGVCAMLHGKRVRYGIFVFLAKLP
jgi:hypothetical protein